MQKFRYSAGESLSGRLIGYLSKQLARVDIGIDRQTSTRVGGESSDVYILGATSFNNVVANMPVVPGANEVTDGITKTGDILGARDYLLNTITIVDEMAAA